MNLEFLKNYKKDILYPVIICFIIIFFIAVNYFSFGDFYYDCGREFLASEAILNGAVPFKDIFLSYFPLSYQINAVIMKIFSSNLDVLRITGSVFSCITAVFIYLILRNYTDETKSFQITVITTLITMFNVSLIFNYVTGYSYAFIYAVCFLFISVYFILRFNKTNVNLNLYASFFLLGGCFALKAEYIFLIIPYLIFCLYKKISFKNIFISFVLFFTPLLLSFSILIVQGFNFNDFINYFEFLKNFMSAESLDFYNAKIFRRNFFEWIQYNFSGLVSFLIPFLTFCIVLYYPLKKNRDKLFVFLNFILSIIFFVCFVIKGDFAAYKLFNYICILNIIILIAGIFNKKLLDFSFVFLVLIQIFLCIRFNFTYPGGYAAYTMPIGIMAFCLFFGQIIKNKNFNKLFMSFMITISILNAVYFSLSTNLFINNKIITPKGIYKTDANSDPYTIKEVLSYMENIKKDKTILILPEGAMFNYLSNRKTNLKYYQLLPNHIEAIGEENIVNDLKLNGPDYILITNIDYTIYGKDEFCKGFGEKICEFIFENYNRDRTFSNGRAVEIRAYKKN